MADYDVKYDLNKDGKIDDVDYGIFFSKYGLVDANNPLSVACDFNGDSVVDITDFGMFQMHYGAVKESSNNALTIGLIIAGAVIGLFAWKSHTKKK
jgi:uncharacterized protein (DUF2141 family)